MKLTAVAREQSTKNELKRADDENFEALFGNHTIAEKNTFSVPSAGPAPATGTVRDGAVKHEPNNQNGSPVRRRYTQYYSSGGHVRTESERIIAKDNSRATGGKTGATDLVDVS